MKEYNKFKIVITIMCSIFLSFNVFSCETEEKADAITHDKTEEQANMKGRGQECYSARKCRGKVLSNRDQHNCKVKSRGKSWRASANSSCINL